MSAFILRQFFDILHYIFFSYDPIHLLAIKYNYEMKETSKGENYSFIHCQKVFKCAHVYLPEIKFFVFKEL